MPMIDNRVVDNPEGQTRKVPEGFIVQKSRDLERFEQH